MTVLPLELYPTTYSFNVSDLMIFEAENEKTKTRPLKRGFKLVSVSFNFSEIQYLDFLEFFNIDCDYGMISFLARFEDDISDVEYSFIQEFNVSFSDGIDNRYRIETVLGRVETDCEAIQLEFNEMVNVGIYTLKGVNMDFENTASCSGDLINYIDQIYIGIDCSKNDDNRY